MSWTTVGTSTVRSPERTVALTDGVVAIAMTLLVLPLTEYVPEVDTDRLGAWATAHADVFLGFVTSFVVIYVFWGAHDAAFSRMTRVTAPVRQVNMLWLLTVAFLPFPTALVDRHNTASTVSLYLLTMGVLSLLTNGLVVASWRQLGEAGGTTISGWRARTIWITPAVMLICALVGSRSPEWGLRLLLVLIPVRIAEGRLRHG